MAVMSLMLSNLVLVSFRVSFLSNQRSSRFLQGTTSHSLYAKKLDSKIGSRLNSMCLSTRWNLRTVLLPFVLALACKSKMLMNHWWDSCSLSSGRLIATTWCSSTIIRSIVVFDGTRRLNASLSVSKWQACTRRLEHCSSSSQWYL